MSSIAVPYLVVNAFTEHAMAGNPAAVVLLASPQATSEDRPTAWPPDAALQGLAQQFGLSQTAYLLPRNQDRSHAQWAIRWFSPEREVPLCGHASLAACHALQHWGHWQPGPPLALNTLKRGSLICFSNGTTHRMGFPSYETSPEKMPDRVARGLGLPCAPVSAHRSGPLLLLQLETAEQVEQARPNPRVLTHWHRHGVAITAQDPSDKFDFVTRMFAPRFGIDEDPACGSAHCVLGPYWAARLNKNQLLARQASARGGEIGMVCRRSATAGSANPPSDSPPSVELSGTALTALCGELGPQWSHLLRINI